MASTRAGTPSSSARDLLLAQQFEMAMYSIGPVDCHDELSLIKQGHRVDRPLAWVSSSSDEVVVRLGQQTFLCLYGFPKNKPITVTVKAGGRTYTTPVKRVATLTAEESSQNELFNDRELEVQDIGDGLLQSGGWTFLPSDPARKAIALSGRLTLAASSGDVKTTYEVPLRWNQGAEPLDGWEHSRRMAVYGYPVGARVPIGLYRVGLERAVLERKVGEVVMPRSRVAVFSIPQDVFRVVSVEPPAGKDSYCLSVPEVRACVTWPV
ncbi:hypothetical protein GCM10011579_019740 [Streptomyces albiflavescens]|uniref:Uncharacterized protein n=1 Tax=Streptomyces albiflavescens TaxID=1623582 RepID=A0A918D1W0_9ACTN|nr:hypothetical protein [Streptomyces albiflavescens]GGN57460.1 hypothetical protein GCM10011579_019740 [Streptomyces albiflavescens]